MEFERAIFRMHERILQGNSAANCINIFQKACCFYTVLVILNFVAYHKLYVNNSEHLTKAIEDQILFNRHADYQHLPYTHQDAYSFCNLKTFNRNDTEAIHNYANEELNATDEEIANKTNEELIAETDLQNCEFGRDELFSIIIMKDNEVANELIEKAKNKEIDIAYFNTTEAKDKVKYWYYYSNQLPIFHLANNEYRVRHRVKENMVIISERHLAPENAFLRVCLGYTLDYDLIIVNQLMFTFRR